jgi:hypothetical protein
VPQRQIVQAVIIGSIFSDKVIVLWEIGQEVQAPVREADSNRVIALPSRMVRNPGSRVIDGVPVPKRARENRDGQTGHAYRRCLSKQLNVFCGLRALPGITVPNAAGAERIVITGDDIHRACYCPAFKKRERSFGDCLGNAMIVEQITSDENELNLMLGSLGAKLLDCLEACLANPIAGTLLEPCDAKAQVEIRGVQESDHCSALRLDI